MQNFQVEDKNSGKKYWISRSIAIAAVLMTKDGKFIAERRGPGCPDFIGKLVFPCGYLDFDETLKECAIREIWEELGIKVDDLYFVGINSSPEDNRQNVTVRFLAVTGDTPSLEDSSTRGGENNEVSEVVIMTLEEIHQSKNDWAFGHADLAEYVVKNMDKIKNQNLKYV